MDELDDIFSALDEADEQERKAVTKAKKAREVKKPETIEEAFQRVLNLKLKDDERSVVFEVQSLLEVGELKRADPLKKLSKKEVFELWKERLQVVREQKKQHVLDTKPENFWIVTDIITLHKVREMLKTEPLTAWDSETTGLDIFLDKIVGFSAYLPKHDVAFYIPFGHTTGQTQVAEADALAVAREYLQNPNNKTIWHHHKYDGHMLLNHGIVIANPYWDTQVVAKILNENESHKLKLLYAKYVMGGQEEAITFEDLFEDQKISDKDIFLSGIYAAWDGFKTYKLFEFQKPFIDTRDNLKTVWYQIEQKLLDVDLRMERTGFNIDFDYVDELIAKYQPILDQAHQDLLSAFNIDEDFLAKMSEVLGSKHTELNVNSPNQLAYLIYDYLGVDENIGTKFKKARRSTAGNVVDKICEEFEELKPLLKYRQLFKLLNTYLVKFKTALEPTTGRMHSRFNNMSSEDDKNNGTATGRYSSSEYVSDKHSHTGVKRGTNLQNIPSKGIGVETRRCFVPKSNDWIFVAGDLSQIEPRVISVILAERYGDYSMQNFYIEGKDLYVQNAMLAFDFEEKYCVDGAYDPSHTFQPRKLMKQGVLSFLYGSSAKSFAREMKITEEVAQMFFDKMIEAFPGLKAFREDVIKNLLTKGNVAHAETLFGRKRRFESYRKDHAELQRLNRIPRFKMTALEQDRRNELWRACAKVERAALNTVVQGSAADILKQIMIRMNEFTRDRGYEMPASIHDEIITAMPKSDLTPELIEEFRKIFTDTVQMSTPLKTDVVIMERWMDEVKPVNWDFENQCQKVA